MRNWNAFWALVVALLAIAVIVAAGAVARLRAEISYLEAAGAVPVTFFLSLLALSLASRARARHQRTLGRVGGERLAWFARSLAVLALLLAITGVVALAVFAVLLVASDGSN